MLRRDLASALIISSAAAVVLSDKSEAQTCTPPCYLRTAAEITASVVPTNSSYPPLCVDRYGTNTTPGTTSMTAAFNAAMKVAQVSGGTVTYGGTNLYLLDAPVNCTVAGTANQPGILVQSVGPIGHDLGFGILAKHGGVAVFDCTGADCIEFRDVSIHTDAATFPQTGILFARNAAAGSQLNRLTNCRINGSFSVACFYNYGSEDDVLVGCYFSNLSAIAGTKVAVWTANNISGLTSPFTAIASGTHSCIDHNVFGCQAYNKGGTSTSDVYYLEQVDSWKCFGGWAYSGSLSSSGRALVYIDQTNATSNFCTLQGLTGENGSPLQAYGVLFSANTATPSGWTVDSCRLPNTTFAIAAASSGTTLDNFQIRGISEQASHGLSVPGTLQNSTVHEIALVLSLGTSKQNTLIGDSGRWTITSRLNDYWVDQGSNKTWVPGTAGLTIAGGLTVNRPKFAFSGALVTVNLVLAPGTSIAASPGAQITGLPATANDYSALVNVTDLVTGAMLSGGYVVNNKIVLSGWAATPHDIAITAQYFAG